MNTLDIPLLDENNIFASALLCREWVWRSTWYFSRHYDWHFLQICVVNRLADIGNATEDFDFLLSCKNNYQTYNNRKKFVIEEPMVEDTETCVLCCETLSEDDLKHRACVCSAQTCLRCIQNIKTSRDSKCPFCRREYSEETVENVKNAGLAETPTAVSGPTRMRRDRSDTRNQANINMPAPAWMQRIDQEYERTSGETQGQDARVHTRNMKRREREDLDTYLKAIKVSKKVLNHYEMLQNVLTLHANKIRTMQAIGSEIMLEWKKLPIMKNWRETRGQITNYNKIVADMFGQFSINLRNIEKEHCTIAWKRNFSVVAFGVCQKGLKLSEENCAGLPSILATWCDSKKAKRKLNYCVKIMQKRSKI